jgi:hypothetical protein
MGNRCNDYYLLFGNPELGRVEGIRDLQEWSSSRVFGGVFGGALVDVRERGLSEDLLMSGAVVS